MVRTLPPWAFEKADKLNIEGIIFKTKKSEEHLMTEEDARSESDDDECGDDYYSDEEKPYDALVEYEWSTLDQLDKSSLRAFTWNPDPSKYPSNIPRKQYKCLLKYVLLGGSQRCFRKFVFVPELTECGNIHIHGWYIIKDPICYNKFFLPKCKQLGFVKIKWNNIDQEWCSYMCKKVAETSEIVGEDLPCPLTDTNWKAYSKEWKNAPRPKLYPNKTKPLSTTKITDYFPINFD